MERCAAVYLQADDHYMNETRQRQPSTPRVPYPDVILRFPSGTKYHYNMKAEVYSVYSRYNEITCARGASQVLTWGRFACAYIDGCSICKIWNILCPSKGK